MTFDVEIKPAGISYQSTSTKTILDAALDSKLFLDHSCKRGNCGLCEATLLSGSVKNEHGQIVSYGKILTCSSYAETNISLKAVFSPELAEIELVTLPCKVESMSIKARDILVLNLRLPPNANFNYLPGQYIDLSYRGVRRSYSVANTKGSSTLELHIRLLANGEFSHLLSDLTSNQLMRLEGPKGTFFVREADNPLIFLAGGTGFAPIKAMVEELIKQQSKRQIYIYWGMTTSSRFYTEIATEWSQLFENINFIPVVSEQDDAWPGRKGLVHEAVAEDFNSLAHFHVYACGAPILIDKARALFLEKELVIDNFYADAFVPSN